MHRKLVAIAGPWKGSSFPLAEGTHLVGRESESGIQLDEAAVSRRHCSITRAGDRCTVRDLGSHNGTFVNGSAVKEADMAPGDEIHIGSSKFVLLAPGDVADPLSGHPVELRPEDSIYLSSSTDELDLPA